jgi:hypothetical protein
MRFSILLLAVLALAACGTVADPRPTFEPTEVGQARLVKADDETLGEELVDDIEETAEDVAEVVEETAEDVAEEVEETAEDIAETTEDTGEEVEETAEDVAEDVEETVEDAGDTAEDVVEDVEETAEDAGEAVEDVVEDVEETEETVEEPAEPVVINGVEGFPEDGEFWFASEPNSETGQYCITCHNPTEPIPATGPYVYGIANVAGERVEGMTAVEYLYDSIVNPNDHIAPPQVGPDGNEFTWNPGVMPQNWDVDLTDQQIADIVAYLMTLNQAE